MESRIIGSSHLHISSIIKDFVGHPVLSLQRANEVNFMEMFYIDLKSKERIWIQTKKWKRNSKKREYGGIHSLIYLFCIEPAGKTLMTKT